MELLLWRWSTSAQIASALMIAAFFVVLGRSFRRVELSAWIAAWLANLGALAVTSIFWLAQPSSPLAFLAIRWGYFFSKTMFVVCLAIGAATFVRGRVARISPRLAAAIAVGCLVAAVALDSINLIGVAQSAAIAIVLGGSAAVLFAKRVNGSEWLATGFALRAALAVIETLAYGSRLVPNQWSGWRSIDIVLAAHSSFDTGAEWAIALGCVLMLHRKIQRELSDANREMVAAKEQLQGLVDRDPLTGLANRRALPSIFAAVRETGATVVFFDLNDFKEINDGYGHHEGDACLRRFAEAVGAAFPRASAVRYAGDEFVLVVPAERPDTVSGGIELLRERLRFERSRGPEIRFAYGVSSLEPQGDADAALQAADESMYRDKARTSRALRKHP
jgi:diguanylate cyclase (GGDEF)-like protein